jgi:alkaline phosphatase D
MAWLETQLQDCKGPFIVLSSGTMWSDYISDGKDSWGKHDREGRERIFDLIEQNRVPGVLLISGDRHGARGFRIPRRSGFAFYEFEVASLGGKRVSSTPVLRSKARIRSPNCSVSEAPAPSGSSP